VPKTRAGVLSRRFARPNRSRRDAAHLPGARWSDERADRKAAEYCETVRSRFNPSGGRDTCSNAPTGRFGLIAQFRRSAHVRVGDIDADGVAADLAAEVRVGDAEADGVAAELPIGARADATMWPWKT
jgi:hypothetical protein